MVNKLSCLPRLKSINVLLYDTIIEVNKCLLYDTKLNSINALSYDTKIEVNKCFAI